MKTLLIIAGFGIAILSLSGISKDTSSISDHEGISFSELTWEETLKKAENENKLIFLDAYASWCGPCKMLKKRTFTDMEAGEYFNTNFINVAFDMEKGAGPELARKYGVRAYPTLFILDPKGKVVAVSEGYINPGKLIRFGKFGMEKYRNSR